MPTSLPSITSSALFHNLGLVKIANAEIPEFLIAGSNFLLTTYYPIDPFFEHRRTVV